jgi:hypothetical protein
MEFHIFIFNRPIIGWCFYFGDYQYQVEGFAIQKIGLSLDFILSRCSGFFNRVSKFGE